MSVNDLKEFITVSHPDITEWYNPVSINTRGVTVIQADETGIHSAFYTIDECSAIKPFIADIETHINNYNLEKNLLLLFNIENDFILEEYSRDKFKL